MQIYQNMLSAAIVILQCSYNALQCLVLIVAILIVQITMIIVQLFVINRDPLWVLGSTSELVE